MYAFVGDAWGTFRGKHVMPIRWLDAGRGIAILMVVAGHTIDWTRADEVDPVVKVLLSLIVSCSLPMFFFISGTLAAAVPSMPWRKVLTRKVAPLLWIFVLWQPVVFAYKLLAELTLPGQDAPSFATTVGRLALSPVRPTGELWFIWALALFFFLARLLRAVPIWAQVAAATVLSIAWMSATSMPLAAAAATIVGVGWNGVFSYWVFFALGVAINRARSTVAVTPRLAGVLVAAGWVLLVSALSLAALTAVPVLSFGIKLVGLAGGIGLARALDWSKVLQYFGRATMPVYLTHTAVIVGVLAIAQTSGIAPLPWTGMGALGLWAVAVIVGVGVDRLVVRTGATWLVRTTPGWLTRRIEPPVTPIAGSLSR